MFVSATLVCNDLKLQYVWMGKYPGFSFILCIFCEKILRLQDDNEFEGIVFELSQNKFDTNFTDWMKTKVWGRQLEKIFR